MNEPTEIAQIEWLEKRPDGIIISFRRGPDQLPAWAVDWLERNGGDAPAPLMSAPKKSVRDAAEEIVRYCEARFQIGWRRPSSRNRFRDGIQDIITEAQPEPIAIRLDATEALDAFAVARQEVEPGEDARLADEKIEARILLNSVRSAARPPTASYLMRKMGIGWDRANDLLDKSRMVSGTPGNRSWK